MYYKNAVMPRSIGGLIEDIFQNGINRAFVDEGWNDGNNHTPVNIRETEGGYELQVIAPGRKKEDFKVNVDRNILTISFEHVEENADQPQTAKWLRTEYKMRSFKRSFTLNDKIDASNIKAQYIDGILNVTLPKKEQSEQKAQEITVG